MAYTLSNLNIVNNTAVNINGFYLVQEKPIWSTIFIVAIACFLLREVSYFKGKCSCFRVFPAMIFFPQIYIMMLAPKDTFLIANKISDLCLLMTFPFLQISSVLIVGEFIIYEKTHRRSHINTYLSTKAIYFICLYASTYSATIITEQYYVCSITYLAVMIALLYNSTQVYKKQLQYYKVLINFIPTIKNWEREFITRFRATLAMYAVIVAFCITQVVYTALASNTFLISCFDGYITIVLQICCNMYSIYISLQSNLLLDVETYIHENNKPIFKPKPITSYKYIKVSHPQRAEIGVMIHN